MSAAIVVAFRESVALLERADEATLTFPGGRLAWREPPSGFAAALRILAHDGACEETLSDRVFEEDGGAGLAFWYYSFERFAELRLLRYIVRTPDDARVLTAHPMADGANFSIVDADPAVAYRLSRFAFLRREADGLVIESPRSKVRVSLHGALALAVVAALAAPCNASDLHAAIEGLSRDAAVACVSVLASADLIGPIDQAGALAEDLDRALAHWEFHDLLFHSRSRLGRHDNRAGGTFRFESRFPPLPALKRPPASDVIALRQPDLANIARRDRSLTEILQARRSIRRYGTEPITLEQLGEFLFRIGRVEEVFAPEPKGGRPYEISRRPYPSGGAAYDLEIYPAVKLCTGLATGLYHYDPFSHALRSIDVCRGRLDALLADAQGTAKMLFTPQIVIVLASRFQRLSWKYEMLAYATTLKNVGVLFQTMYLVATAMDLAPCALGTGNSDLFAAAAGTDYFGETSVGEFLLGSMPTAG